MSDVATWAIIVPPVVVAVFAYAQQRAQQNAARRQAAVDELRLVIDECAVAIAETVTALPATHIAMRAAITINDAAAFNGTDDAFESQLEKLRLTHARLRIRGAPIDLVGRHGTVIEALRAAHVFATGKMHSGQELTPNDYEQRADVVRVSQLAFENAAADLVGHDLRPAWKKRQWANLVRLGRRALP